MLTARGEMIAEEVVEQDIERSFRRIQEAIDDPTGRLKLYLNSMSFPKVDYSIERIKTLEQLFCERNPLLSTLPVSICQLSNLRVMDLNHCALTHLPEDLSRLRHLERLDLSHNLLSRLIWDVSGWVASLRMLNICHNRLEYVSPSCMHLFLALKKKHQEAASVQLHAEQALSLFPNEHMFQPKATAHIQSAQEEQFILGNMLPDCVESCTVCGETVVVGRPRVYIHFWAWVPASCSASTSHPDEASTSDGGASSAPATRSQPTSVQELPVAAPSTSGTERFRSQYRIPVFYPLCTKIDCHLRLHKVVSMSGMYAEAGVEQCIRLP